MFSDNLQRGGGHKRHKAILMDWSLLNEMVLVEKRVCLTTRQIAALQGIAEYLRWKSRWENCDATWQDLDEFATDIEARLMTMCPVDCEEIEPCIEGSETIININTTLIDFEAAFTEINTTLTNVNTSITEIEIALDGNINVLPPAPTVGEPDELCSAAVYIVSRLVELIERTIDDAATITLTEFLEALLGIGGFDSSLLKTFWDFIIANSYPELLADVQAAQDEVIKSLYCNELDRDLTFIDIDTSSTMSSEVKGAYNGALFAVTEGKLALWAFVGSQASLTSEACDCGECVLTDFLTVDGGYSHVNVEPVAGNGWINGLGVWSSSVGWNSTTSNDEANSGRSRGVHIGLSGLSGVAGDTCNMIFDITKGFVVNGALNCLAVQFFNAGTLVSGITRTFTQTSSPQTDASLLATASGAYDQIILFVRCGKRSTNADPGGTCRIKSVEVCPA